MLLTNNNIAEVDLWQIATNYHCSFRVVRVRVRVSLFWLLFPPMEDVFDEQKKIQEEVLPRMFGPRWSP